MSLKFAILGAGAGGQTMAAVLTNKGYSAKLYDIDQAKIDKLNELGKITVTGKIECVETPELITTDLAAAMQGVDVIMVTTTTDAHKTLANQCVPYLRDGQIFMLNPGHVGGALEVSHIIRDVHQCKADIIIAEAGDLMYACRVVEVGTVFQSGLKAHTKVATFPGKDVDRLMEVLKPIFTNLQAVPNILDTGFEGGGAMLHPIPSLMNVNRTDSNEPYDYYMAGITPSIAKVVSACDAERVAVCEALGMHPTTLVEDLQKMYHLTENDLYKLLQSNEAYKGLKSPTGVGHRFFIEDTMCGLVPLASIGHMLGVKTPIMDAYIDIATIVCGRDFWKEGRTAENLGLAGKSVEEIHKMLA